MILHQDRYDSLFQWYWDQAAAKYALTDANWHLLKAQCKQESGFNPEALSKAMAKGLMQFTDATWGADHRSPFNPEASIDRGADYMGSLWAEFKAEKGLERWRFALAAYNAGIGNILKAQELAKAGGAPTDAWGFVGGFLNQVTGPDNSTETLLYVRTITADFLASQV